MPELAAFTIFLEPAATTSMGWPAATVTVAVVAAGAALIWKFLDVLDG